MKTVDSLKSFGVANSIEILPTGIDIAKYMADVSEDLLIELRHQYGIDKNQKIILTLCRLSYEKNIAELIKGLKQYLLKNETSVFLIVGDGPAKNEMQAIVKELGLSGKVIFTGMIEPEYVPRFYQVANVFVSASITETQGLTYIEALASGLPLVCKEDPCLDGLIEPKENGFTYTNIEDITKYIEMILSKPKHIVSQISRGIALNYGIGSFAEKAVMLYEQ